MGAQDSNSQLVWMITGLLLSLSEIISLTHNCPTGCSTGFGRRFVPAILRRGDKVIATSRQLKSIQNLASEISGLGLDANNVRIMELDLEWTTAKLDDVVKQALQAWGHIDVLINNGGIAMKSIIEEAK